MSHDGTPILPGATIGILGSGQLGRMLAFAARRMGYRVHVLSPGSDTPTGQVADREVNADYDDLRAVADFAAQVDVVTYEFENVPAATAAAAGRYAPLHPGPQVLHVAQNRLREKRFFQAQGLPTPPFAAVDSDETLAQAVAAVGTPAILKTATAGYDGKGQAAITTPQEAAPQWARLGRRPAILEQRIAFEREVSVVAARGLDGSFAHYGVIENEHANHILDVSMAPAFVSPAVAAEAVAMARAVLDGLEVVGVLCVEFFVTPAGGLLLNEIAPRPHNSGHLTVDACVTSQFEQQLRAVCGLSLGSTRYLQPAAMANLLGDLWQVGPPDWSTLRSDDEIKLHLYGKTVPRPGRKMGHLTLLAAAAAAAATRLRAARQRLATQTHSAA